jgi:hypothetical protein
MEQVVDGVRNYLHAHQISIIKDIIVPAFGIDKILALIALLYAIRSFKSSYKVGKVNFLIQLTASHRDIWSKIHQSNLIRIKDPKADINSITEDESRYVIFIIMNMRTLFEAHINKVYDFNKASQFDTGKFFNLPIPNHVWQNSKIFYDDAFVKFMDAIKINAKIRMSGVNPKSRIYLFYMILKKKIKKRFILYKIKKRKVARLAKNINPLNTIEKVPVNSQ